MIYPIVSQGYLLLTDTVELQKINTSCPTISSLTVSPLRTAPDIIFTGSHVAAGVAAVLLLAARTTATQRYHELIRLEHLRSTAAHACSCFFVTDDQPHTLQMALTTNNHLLRIPQDLKVKMERVKREIAEAKTLPADLGEQPIKQESSVRDGSDVGNKPYLSTSRWVLSP